MTKHDRSTARAERPWDETSDTWSEPPTSEVRAVRDSWAAPEAKIGRRIADRYELQRVLGYGAAGAVYEAFDHADGRPVAIKLLHSHLETSDAHVARFAREVQAATSIRHSAVVRVLDAGRDGRSLYLVMELLEGELLLDRIERAPLSACELIELGRQLMSALAAAHAHGVVHRDVKPENLFLMAPDRGLLRLKILDFGIAKLTKPDPTITFQTLDGMILGTPEYMSPEICRGMPVTEAADLWAAAAVLFHAASGRPPFEDEHVGQLLIRIVRERARSLRELRADLPAAFVEAVDRGLHPEVEERWPTAAAFAAALTSGSASIDALDWDEL